MKAVITAGGRGTRLRPITHTRNKHLIPIANKSMINYAIEKIAEAGIKDIGIVVNMGDREIESFIGNGEKWGVQITYIDQEAPLGLAHVILTVEEFIGGEPFVFYLGDNILLGGIESFISSFIEERSDFHLTLAKVRDPQRFGVAEMKGDKIVGIEEKPEEPKSDLAVAGIYIYGPHIFWAARAIKPSERGELEISEAHQWLINKGFRVSHSVITGWWKDTGKPEDLLEANQLVLANIGSSSIDPSAVIDPDVIISGKVIIGKETKIQGRSEILGPVIIGEEVLIGNSCIGPYTSIGNGVLIKGSEVQNSILFEDSAVVDVQTRIERSILGREAQIVSPNFLGQPSRSCSFCVGDQSVVVIP